MVMARRAKADDMGERKSGVAAGEGWASAEAISPIKPVRMASSITRGLVSAKKSATLLSADLSAELLSAELLSAELLSELESMAENAWLIERVDGIEV